MLNLILYGPPGAGKGTQSAKLIEQYNLLHLATGDMLRAEIANGSPLGLLAQTYIDQGLLLPDEVVIKMIEGQLDNAQGKNGVIYDGFPRTVGQAEALDRMLAERGTPIDMMISLVVHPEELIKRVVNRGLTSGRSDDTAEMIEKRIEEYRLKTAPVGEYYRQQGKLREIEGLGEIDEIFTSLCAVVDSLL